MDILELIMVLSVAVFLPLTILKLTLDYRRERMRIERENAGQGSALTVRELKELVREVAEEVNEPLIERLDRLEGRSSVDLDQTMDQELDPMPERTVGRRVT